MVNAGFANCSRVGFKGRASTVKKTGRALNVTHRLRYAMDPIHKGTSTLLIVKWANPDHYSDPTVPYHVLYLHNRRAPISHSAPKSL